MVVIHGGVFHAYYAQVGRLFYYVLAHGIVNQITGQMRTVGWFVLLTVRSTSLLVGRAYLMPC